ncbi:ABC transporter transmembrane domain-containing protein [Arsenicicoccus piscis]|uniref:ABC transmembrane type-1 domain-containing protein n=1 Tax=Arsenicicoccus piscis TaxID=673954 RepID=A0ABQ6HT21_9MICO|nr:hypothetical protein GCM10025862_27210 [Arsenicicoccus piscis]
MSITTHSPFTAPRPLGAGSGDPGGHGGPGGSSGHSGRGGSRGHGGPGPGGPGPGGPRPAQVDPADRAQLDESPVSWRRVAALFSPYRGQIALVMTLIVGTSLLGTASPFLVRDIVDQAIPHQDVRLLLLAVGGLVAITVVTQLFGVLQTWISSRVGQRLMHGLRTRVFDHLQGQSLGFFTRTRGGEVQSRLTNDIAGMQSVITDTATSIASNVTTAIATAVAMAALSWRLSLLSLVVIPPAIWLTRRVALLRRDLTTRLQGGLAELNGIVDETLSVSGARLTKTLGIGERRSAEFAATSASSSISSSPPSSPAGGGWPRCRSSSR